MTTMVDGIMAETIVLRIINNARVLTLRLLCFPRIFQDVK
jgi:hypothetical protein